MWDFCLGNSLGLQPVGLNDALQVQLGKWSTQAVDGHFEQPTPWVRIDDIVVDSSAKLVGAQPSEVVIMNTLTANLHFMMSAFYRPTPTKFKILTEKKAFPSDTHAVMSQLRLHGFDPATALVEVAPREGEDTLRMEDILEVIHREGDEIALVLFAGIQYYTGQLFDIEALTKAGHDHGCIVGIDLAHAAGNVPLKLHDWDVDFACWCTYKYINSGPGCIGGAFVHAKHSNTGETSEQAMNRLAGWWGHRASDRFKMAPDFIPCEGAYGFRVSNPSVLLVACVRSSLDIFDEAGGMEVLRAKSLLLTGYLEYLLVTQLADECKIFTPSDPAQRGAQLSVMFKVDLDETLKKLGEQGVMCDIRRPSCMRIAPTPLYNSFSDVYEFVKVLGAVLKQ